MTRTGITRRLAIFAGMALLVSMAAMADTIPAGTRLTVRLTSAISSGTAKAGQTFDGTLAKDVVVDGNTFAAAGSPVKGKITSVRPSGRLHKPGYVSMRLTSVNDQAIQTAAIGRQGKSHTKGNVEKIGGGAAAGAVIGALAGGGKGAAIGTLAGGAAGTGVAAYTGKEEAVVPAESVLTFTTTASSGAAARRRTSKK